MIENEGVGERQKAQLECRKDERDESRDREKERYIKPFVTILSYGHPILYT